MHRLWIDVLFIDPAEDPIRQETGACRLAFLAWQSPILFWAPLVTMWLRATGSGPPWLWKPNPGTYC